MKVTWHSLGFASAALSLVALGSLGCGASEPGPTNKPIAAKTTAAKPRCPADADDHPADVQAKMNALQSAIRQCFALGTAGNKGIGKVQLALVIGEDGSVKSAKIADAEGAQLAAADCCSKAAKGTSFASFCGEDVPVNWTYTME
jgi:hypothetical protein